MFTNRQEAEMRLFGELWAEGLPSILSHQVLSAYTIPDKFIRALRRIDEDVILGG